MNDVLILTTVGGANTPWNVSPASGCTRTIDTGLNQFSTWRSTVHPKRNGLWHYTTNCYKTGTVGLAWIGTLCNTNYGTGLSSYTSVYWVIMAHEIGHNFGGNHDFELGQGTTGGIMDYGNGQYPLNSGIYQFHPTVSPHATHKGARWPLQSTSSHVAAMFKFVRVCMRVCVRCQYNQAEMCAQMTSGFKITGFDPYCSAVYTATCGNGVVESGEDCDDTSACCVACKFKTGGVCSPGSAGTNMCTQTHT